MAGITVNGNAKIISYSVQEDATSRDPSNPNAGYGQITYSTDTVWPKLETDIKLVDPYRGRFVGRAVSLSSNNGTVTVTADGALSQLNKWYTVPPYSGSLGGYLHMLKELTGITVPFGTPLWRDIVVPGFVGNVWEGFNRFLVAHQLEVVQIAEQIVVREPRVLTSVNAFRTSEDWTVDSRATAERVTVKWYDCSPVTSNLEVFPFAEKDDEEFQPISVDAGQTVVQEIHIPGSLSSVNQPQCLDYVPANTDYSGTLGAYCVSGNDGKPILADRWKAGGGSLQVEVTDDPSVIRVTVVGSSVEEFAPYRIAATAGESNYYNSLHVTGSGLRWTEHKVEIHSGAPSSPSADETSVEVDNKNIVSEAQAYTMALAAAKGQCGGIVSMSGTATSLNRKNMQVAVPAPKISDFNDRHPNMKISDFNTFYAGKTFGEFQSMWMSYFEDDFSAQSFGNVVGSRARRDEAWFRVKSVTTGPDVVQYNLEMDTTFQDFNEVFSGKNIAFFNEHFRGYRFLDFNERPLKNGS